jgi:hypothetical protein
MLISISCGYNSNHIDYTEVKYKAEELPPSAPVAVSSGNVTQPVTNSGAGGGGCFVK